MDKIKEKKQMILQVIFYVGIFISLLYKALYFQVQGGMYEHIGVLYSIIGSIFVLLAVMAAISFNRTSIVLLVVDIFVSVVIFADVLYSKYYYNPMTITVAFFQAKFLGDIKDSTSAVFNIRDIVVFLDIPFLIILKFFIKEAKTKAYYLSKLFISAVFFIVGVAFVSFVYNTSEKQVYVWEKKKMAVDMGILFYHYDDIRSTTKRVLFSKKEMSNDELQNMEEYKYSKTQNEFSGIADNKNLIIIQLEAIQGFVINAQIGGQEITPNLNKLINESIYAKQLFYQANYGNTSDAEFIVNNSLYPSKTGAAYYEYSSNEYNSIAKMLAQKGYYTAACHGYEKNFWNRTEMYRSLGYEKFYSQEDFKPEKMIGYGICDEEFFKQSLDYLIADSKDKPFFGFMVALSSHHPYAWTNYDVTLDVGEYKDTMLGDYLCAANYVDYAIGEFIEYMKQTGVYDDTVIGLYGDHAALFTDERDNLFSFMSMEDNDVNWSLLQTVPFVLHVPGVSENTTVDVPSGEIDILPTIANIMNVDIPYMYGRDLMNNEYGYAIMPRGNIVTEDYVFMLGEHTFYDMKTREVLDKTEELIENARGYYRRRDVSNNILKCNAFKGK